MSSQPNSARSRHRIQVENEMIRRREREQQHQSTWDGREQYYRHWEKANSKFDDWTSPRYYDANNRLIRDMRKDRDKKELLEKRREKLKRLLDEEQKSYDIEIMVHRNRYLKDAGREKPDDIPTELLKEVNLGLKLEEEERRRHEAEINLYHRWRINNPILREYERRTNTRDLKLSWLDQQIERRMQKEKEEEECKRILRERDEFMRKQREQDDEVKAQLRLKNEELREGLDRQMEEMRVKRAESDELKRREDEERRKRDDLAALEERRRELERRRAERECALFNVRQHKMKLKQKLHAVQENLKEEQELTRKLLELELVERIEDRQKRDEVRAAIEEFLKISHEQQELEKLRQRHMEFLFDSEAKAVYEEQEEIWRQEEHARGQLFKQVLDTIEKQIELNIERNKERQANVVRQREELVRKVEEYDRQLEEIRRQEEARQRDWKKCLDDDVKIKNVKKKQQENLRLRKLDEDLEKVRKEEERLRREIMNIQTRQLPVKPSSRKLLL